MGDPSAGNKSSFISSILSLISGTIGMCCGRRNGFHLISSVPGFRPRAHGGFKPSSPGRRNWNSSHGTRISITSLSAVTTGLNSIRIPLPAYEPIDCGFKPVLQSKHGIRKSRAGAEMGWLSHGDHRALHGHSRNRETCLRSRRVCPTGGFSPRIGSVAIAGTRLSSCLAEPPTGVANQAGLTQSPIGAGNPGDDLASKYYRQREPEIFRHYGEAGTCSHAGSRSIKTGFETGRAAGAPRMDLFSPWARGTSKSGSGCFLRQSGGRGSRQSLWLRQCGGIGYFRRTATSAKENSISRRLWHRSANRTTFAECNSVRYSIARKRNARKKLFALSQR